MNGLTQEEIDFIKNLSHEMKTQDNRSTAQPFGLVIGQKETQVTDYENASMKAIYWNEGHYDTLEDFIEGLKEYFDYENDANECKEIDYILEHCEDIDDLRREEHSINQLLSDSMHVYGYEIVDDYSPNVCGGNFFLTDKSAKAYVETNSHNLKQPFTYGIHLYRNPEMTKLYDVIHKLAEVL